MYTIAEGSSGKTSSRTLLWNLECTRLLFLTEGVCVSVIPSKCDYFVIDSHSRNIIVKADAKGSAILLRIQNDVHLSKYIIDTYDRLGRSMQYEIQEIFFGSSGTPEKENREL